VIYVDNLIFVYGFKHIRMLLIVKWRNMSSSLNMKGYYYIGYSFL